MARRSKLEALRLRSALIILGVAIGLVARWLFGEPNENEPAIRFPPIPAEQREALQRALDAVDRANMGIDTFEVHELPAELTPRSQLDPFGPSFEFTPLELRRDQHANPQKPDSPPNLSWREDLQRLFDTEAFVLGMLGWRSGSSQAGLGIIVAQEIQSDQLQQLIDQLSDPARAEECVDKISAYVKEHGDQREEIVAQLANLTKTSSSLVARAWAIAALATVAGADVDALLIEVHSDAAQPMLVRRWAAAARVSRTKTARELNDATSLAANFPSLGKLIASRLTEDYQETDSVENLISVTIKVPSLQEAIGPAIVAAGPKSVVPTLFAANEQVRRAAAGYLRSMSIDGQPGIAQAVTDALAFNPQAHEVPWRGGSLFIPDISWDREEARKLAGNLVSWHLWCNEQERDLGDCQTQIHNILSSVQLTRMAGYTPPATNTTAQWLETWAGVVGDTGIREILKMQDVDRSRYDGAGDK